MAHEALERQAIRRNKDLQATCAAIVRRLGIAAVFGGMLFGKVGLDPAVVVIKRQDERGRLVSRVWKRWTLLGAAGMAAAGWRGGRRSALGLMSIGTRRDCRSPRIYCSGSHL